MSITEIAYIEARHDINLLLLMLSNVSYKTITRRDGTTYEQAYDPKTGYNVKDPRKQDEKLSPDAIAENKVLEQEFKKAIDNMAKMYSGLDQEAQDQMRKSIKEGSGEVFAEEFNNIEVKVSK
jgi:hypothetical protein